MGTNVTVDRGTIVTFNLNVNLINVPNYLYRRGMPRTRTRTSNRGNDPDLMRRAADMCINEIGEISCGKPRYMPR